MTENPYEPPPLSEYEEEARIKQTEEPKSAEDEYRNTEWAVIGIVLSATCLIIFWILVS